MHTASRAWKPVLALVPALAIACSDAVTEPTSELAAPVENVSPSSATLALVNERPFNSLAKSGRDDAGAEGWNPTEHKSSRLTIVAAGDAPQSASNVAQVLFARGLKGGSEPARAKRSFDVDARTVAVDVWNQLSANWQGPNKAASVLFTLNVDGSKRLAIEAQGAGSAKLVPAVSLWGAPDSRDDLRPNVVTGAEVKRGQWQHWRVTVRMNTVGQKDGLVSVALDGTTVLEYSNVEIVDGGDDDWFDELDWKPKWGGSGDVVAADMTMRWDHVVMHASAERLSDLGTSPTPTPDPTPDPDTTTTPEPEPEPEPEPTPVVTSVVASPSEASVSVGDTKQFAASAKDAAGNTMADASMTWTSSDPTIASISSSGLATARKAGMALLIATSSGVSDTARISVTDVSGGDDAPTTGWHVSPSGRSGNAGTASSPWDLATALSGAGGKVQPGDTVWIRGGTYPDGGQLSVGGTSSASIVFSGYPGETAIIKRQFRGNASYVVIQDLTFEGPINGATNQVYLYDAHHVVFTRNVIRNGDYHAGLSVDESHHFTITYNYIHNNGVDNSHDHGIYFKTTTGTGTVIANNLLINNAARGLSLHDNSGDGVYDVIVAHNTIVGNGSTGLLVNDGDRITVVNNIAMNNGDETNQDQIRVLAGNNNKIWNNLTWHSSASGRAGIENTTSSAMSGNKVGNPLFVSSSDFRLQAGSPAIGMGLAGYTFGLDYAGRTRDSSPDAGAFEHR